MFTNISYYVYKSWTAICLQTINAMTCARTLNDNWNTEIQHYLLAVFHYQTLSSVSKLPDKTEWSGSLDDSSFDVKTA